MLAIRLPPAIEKRLARLAKRTGRTKTYYAREAILKHLEDLGMQFSRYRLAAAPIALLFDGELYSNFRSRLEKEWDRYFGGRW